MFINVYQVLISFSAQVHGTVPECQKIIINFIYWLRMLVQYYTRVMEHGEEIKPHKQNPKYDTKRDVTSPGGGLKFAVWRFVSSPSTANL